MPFLVINQFAFSSRSAACEHNYIVCMKPSCVYVNILLAVSASAQDGIVALGKALMRSRSVSQQSPQGCPSNSANVCQVEHRSFLTSEGGMSVASFLHFSFRQAINAVMLWPVHVQKVPQVCDICCACQSICPFIPTDSGVPWAVDPQKSLQPKTVHGCSVGAAHSRLHHLQESVNIMACVICASRWAAST